jgi:hypothetical protein
MSDTKISALSAAAALDGTELVPVVQAGANVKATASNVSRVAANNSTYRTVALASASITAAVVAGTYALSFGGVAAVSGTGTAYPQALIVIKAADFPTVDGLAPKLRLRGIVSCNDVAPTGNFTLGLYPVTRPGTSGGAGVCIYTLGTVVSGSNGATVSTPAADSMTDLTGGVDFALPADGVYAIGLVTTATIAASAHVHVNAILQMHNA